MRECEPSRSRYAAARAGPARPPVPRLNRGRDVTGGGIPQQRRGPRRQRERTEPSAVPRQPRAWPGASLLSSAFCNALPFYFTALHNAAGPPPLTPAALGSRPARRAHQDKNEEAVPAGESPSLPMTAGWKVRSQPQHRPADTNWAETLTALISSGSTQARPLIARHDTAFIAALVLITFSYTIYTKPEGAAGRAG